MKQLPRWALSIIVVLVGAVHTQLYAQIAYIEPNSRTGSSQAVVVDPVPLAHTAQVLPMDKNGSIVGKGDAAKQAEKVLEELDDVLERAGSSLAKTVKLNVYVARAELAEQVDRVLARRFNGKAKPAVTIVGGDLLLTDVLVAMDAVAVSSLKTKGYEPVHFTKGRANISEVAVLPPPGAIYVAGLADKNELGLATKNTLEKIESAIKHLGQKRSDIVQLKAFLLPMSDVGKVQTAIADYFEGGTVPPVVYVDWVSPGVPVEIEAIVAAPATGSSEPTVTFHTPEGITPSPVYSRLARVHSGKRIYISGLYGEGEAEQDVADIYRQLDALIEKTGSSRDHLAKATYYFSDPKSNARLDAFRPKYYNPKTPPAASKSRAKDVGRVGKGICIDMIAVTR